MINKLIYGVGINDSTTPIIRKVKGKVVWRCPYYLRWHRMIKRCYSEGFLIEDPSYKNCKVHKDWLVFSVFRSWMMTQCWATGEDSIKLHLDKDLFSKGFKCYSEETCTFLHPKVNNFMTECKRDKPFNEIGYKVRLYKSGNVRYQARCCNPFRGGADTLGCFDTPQEAHNAWRTRKLFYAQLLVKEGYTLNNKQSEALLARYK